MIPETHILSLWRGLQPATRELSIGRAVTGRFPTWKPVPNYRKHLPKAKLSKPRRAKDTSQEIAANHSITRTHVQLRPDPHLLGGKCKAQNSKPEESKRSFLRGREDSSSHFLLPPKIASAWQPPSAQHHLFGSRPWLFAWQKGVS